MALGYGRTGTNNFSCAKFIVDRNGIDKGATHSTIASAITDASAGDTIFIKATETAYTENLTGKDGVHLTGFVGDARDGNVEIIGKITMASGFMTISGIKLTTNSDYFLEATGSASFEIDHCRLNASDNDGIHCNTSGSITCRFCTGDISAAATRLFVNTTGTLAFRNCNTSNSGASTTSNTVAGSVVFENSGMAVHCLTSGTGNISSKHCTFDNAPLNLPFLTTVGTGTMGIRFCSIGSGSGAALSIGSGTSLEIANVDIRSTNTNPVTGAGTLFLSNVSFTLTGDGVNTSTITQRVTTIGTLETKEAINEIYGGTGTTTYTTGDVLYASASNTLSKLAVGSNGEILTLAAGVPSWAAAGSGGGSLVFIAKATASTSASVVFTSGITSTYQHYVVYIAKANVSSDSSDLRLRVSNDAGSTYETTTYDSNATSIRTDPISGNTTSTNSMIIIEDQGSASAEDFSSEIHIFDLQDATKISTFFAISYKNSTGGSPSISLASGDYGTAETINAIQFTMSAGNIDVGDFMLYGVAE